MAAVDKPVTEWAERVRAEYLDVPGLALTRWQMRRMWLLDASLCDAVVDTLVASRFLWLRPDNRYARASYDV